MKLSILIGLLLIITISGCGKQLVYQQAGSDKISMPFDSSKAIIIFEADAQYFDTSGPMLVGFAKPTPGKNQYELYEGKTWEFTTYPGAIIPFYAGEKPHGLHAYSIEPGQYAIVRCVFGAPEVDYCPEGYWTRNHAPAGIAFFTISAGEIVNLGKLHVVRVSRAGKSTYEVSIIDNQNSAKDYLTSKWPELGKKLVHRPLQFTY